MSSSKRLELRSANTRLITNKAELLPLCGEAGLFDWYVNHFSKPHSETRKHKMHDLRRFGESLTRSLKCRPGDLQLADVTTASIEQFVQDCSRVYMPSTTNRYVSTVKHFCKKIAERERDWRNPALTVAAVPMPDPEYKGIDEQLAAELIAAAYQSGSSKFVCARAGMLAEIALCTGLRAMELATLRISHISDDGRWFKGVRCKYGKIRNIYLPEDTRENLLLWLDIREAAIRETKRGYDLLSDWDKAQMPLFPTLLKAKLIEPESFFMTYNNLWLIFAKIAQTAAREHVNPHRYRHAFAHNLLDDSGDIRLVAQALGHSNVETTMLYTERPEEAVARASEKAWQRRRGK